MRTYIALALLQTVLAVSHAKKLLVETEDEDMGHPPIIEDPDIFSLASDETQWSSWFDNHDGESHETLEIGLAEPKRTRNKSNKSGRKKFHQHIKALRG